MDACGGFKHKVLGAVLVFPLWRQGTLLAQTRNTRAASMPWQHQADSNPVLCLRKERARGVIQQHLGPDLISSTRLSSCHIQHCSSVSYHTYHTIPAEHHVCILRGESLHRQGLHVWSCLECGGIWLCSRHAGSYPQESGFRPYSQVGRQFLFDSNAGQHLDRAELCSPHRRPRSSLVSSQNPTIDSNSVFHWL